MMIFLNAYTFIITCLGCLIISGGFLNSLYASQHSLIVKFTAQSTEYIQWKNNERRGTIRSLVSTLGTHSSRPLLRSQILDLLMSTPSAKSKVKDISLSALQLESLAIIEYNADISPEIASKKISSYSFIEYAEPKPVHTFNAAPNDPMISMQNYLNQIHAFEAWDYYELSARKDSILISIVDTGIDTNHEDLSSALYINSGEDGSLSDLSRAIPFQNEATTLATSIISTSSYFVLLLLELEGSKPRMHPSSLRAQSKGLRCMSFNL
jgi:hypothetical protein